MSYKDLISSNFSIDLVKEIEGIDLSKCSNHELIALKTRCQKIKEHADILTLDDEIVGYTYFNLGVLNPKIEKETAKRKIKIFPR